jgi:hypothetical protein
MFTSHEWFVVLLGLSLLGLARWAFKQLPNERWQILACVPTIKDPSGRWNGLNLTYYGLLTANALVLAVAVFIVLMGALDVPTSVTLSLILAALLVCLPAAKWVALLVEGTSSTFTVAGAFFVGMFVVPLLLWICNGTLAATSLPAVPVIPALAALMIAYAFGEGLGRLACISFGCCYGKPLDEIHPVLRKVFDKWNFVFSGKMKKIAYASALDGKRVVPVQAITSVFFVGLGLISTLLFLRGQYAAAFLLTAVATQGWRFVSEAFRADYRGGGSISAYQVMGIGAIVYCVGLASAFNDEPASIPYLSGGIEALWQPAIVLLLQALWVLVFLFFGKSMVTDAEISFRLRHDRI